MVTIVTWLLVGLEITFIVILITELRRSHGQSCLCVPPYRHDSDPSSTRMQTEMRRQLVVQAVTWISLMHDAFQIAFSAAATHSQVSANWLPASVCADVASDDVACADVACADVAGEC